MIGSGSLLQLARGVSFDEAKHEYWYKGKQLSGITGLITKKLNMKIPDGFMDEHKEEGLHVHKAIQGFIETGRCESIHPGVRWLVDRWQFDKSLRYSEVLVSDFKQYASAIDVVDDLGDGLAIYDIKKGQFKRDYVTWQLSIYKYFAEKVGKVVKDCTCICLRDQDFYKIFPKSHEEVERLLYG
jgi:hypothetical protein